MHVKAHGVGSASECLNPVQIWLLIEQMCLNGFKKDGKSPLALQSAGLPQAKDAFHKTVAFFPSCAEATFAPQHGKP